MQDTTGKAACIISSLGSIAWAPAAFGHDLLAIAGQTGGIMLSTVLALVGGYTIAYKLDMVQ